MQVLRQVLVQSEEEARRSSSNVGGSLWLSQSLGCRGLSWLTWVVLVVVGCCGCRGCHGVVVVLLVIMVIMIVTLVVLLVVVVVVVVFASSVSKFRYDGQLSLLDWPESESCCCFDFGGQCRRTIVCVGVLHAYVLVDAC